MPGETPKALAAKLRQYKNAKFECDLVVISCMLNGMARSNKNFQVIPANYEDQVYELFEAAGTPGLALS